MQALPLVDGLNPAWTGRIATLVAAAVRPLLATGNDSLSESDGPRSRSVSRRSSPGKRPSPRPRWRACRPLRLRELSAGELRQQLTALISEDVAAGDANQRVEQVERMIRYHRDLVRLLRNFVNFSDFTARAGPYSKLALCSSTGAVATCASGRGSGQARERGRPGARVPALLRLHAQIGRKALHRRGSHGWRDGQPYGRAQWRCSAIARATTGMRP